MCDSRIRTQGNSRNPKAPKQLEDIEVLGEELRDSLRVDVVTWNTAMCGPSSGASSDREFLRVLIGHVGCFMMFLCI